MVGAYNLLECPLAPWCRYRGVGELCVGTKVLNCRFFKQFMNRLLKWVLVNVDTLETRNFVIRSDLKSGRIVVEVRKRGS